MMRWLANVVKRTAKVLSPGIEVTPNRLGFLMQLGIHPLLLGVAQERAKLRRAQAVVDRDQEKLVELERPWGTLRRKPKCPPPHTHAHTHKTIKETVS